MNRTEWSADTGYWPALANSGDALHERARLLSAALPSTLVTTEAILLEVGDALALARFRSIAVVMIREIRQDADIVVVKLDDDLSERALALYAARSDKTWGITDCISFRVMQDRGITEALAYDQHFVQAGFRALLRTP